jgi:uncharacterized protein
MTMPRQRSPLHRVLPLSPPPRYKTSLLAWIVVCVISSPLNAVLSPIYAQTPKMLHGAISAATSITFMNYAVMPLTLRLFQAWLYGNARNNNRKTH